MKPGRPMATLALAGVLTSTALLALGLVANAWTTYRGARAVAPGMNRGQADLLGAGFWDLVSATEAGPDSAQLATFLAANAHRGLRYAALLTARGTVVASVGVSLGSGTPPPVDGESGRIPLVPVGSRIRAYFPRPSAGAIDGPSYLAIELEPTAAARLMRTARRSLVIAGVGATILFVVAWLLLRTYARYHRATLRLEEQRRLTMLGQMSAVMAHEIRNPLAALKGHAQLAIERLAPGSRERTCVEHVVVEADRLDALTADLLSFARNAPLELGPVDPVELMRLAARDVMGDDPFAIDTASAPPVWHVDAARMRQALVNLIDNARQAAPRREPPRGSVSRVDDSLVFEVRDFGPGLPPGAERRIFEPFFTTRTNGTGLGLAIASRVAELHGGIITASTHPEGGAVFRLALPSRTR